ncbi:MAG: TonB-dependent receptor plug domain-containing protein [Marinicella sp.]
MNQLLKKHIAKTLYLATAISTTPLSIHAESTSENNNSSIVTGSRIAHSDVTSNFPVTIYTREDILRSGESNAADFIRSLPINSFGSFRPQPGTTIQENSFVSLLGISPARTLILIDGRRMPKSPTSAEAANLNMLPMGAIERIEVLAEGSSAIYGTDAIGGVINIITRKEFQGAEIMLGSGQPSIPKSGGETEYGSVVFGSFSEHSSLVAGVSWNEREIVFERDVPWPRRGASIYGNSFTTITDGYDNFDWTSFVDACDFPNSAFYTVYNAGSPNGIRCAYDFSLVASEDASSENKAFYVNASHKLNGKWTLKANTLFSQSESFGRYAPVPDSSYFSTPLSVNSPNNPTNPNSPLYDPSLSLEPQVVNWWHRFDALGNRDTTVKSQIMDMSLNVLGKIGLADLEIGIRHTDNRSSDVGKNYLLRSAAQALIEDGSYNLQNPYAASENVLNAMRFTSYRDARFDQNELFAHITFDLIEFNGGTSKALVGVEYLEEKYFDLADPQSQSEQVGGTAGTSAFARRDTQSIFFETQLPIFQQLSVNLAGRYDDYSDLGDDLAGKLSIFFQPLKQISLYSSYSTNHSTPNLKIMNSFNSSFVATVDDWRIGCMVCSYEAIISILPNPDLDSEQTDQINFILNYKPTTWLDLSIGYWDTSISSKIRYFSAQQLRDAEINGQPAHPGLGCLRSPSGAITHCITGYANAGSTDQSGLDLTIDFRYSLFGGIASNQLIATHALDLSDNGSNYNLINSPGYPEQRAVMNNSYQLGNWELIYNINMIGTQAGEYGRSQRAPTWVTHDVQLSYQLPWQSQLTIGAKNVGEKYPPIYTGLITNRDYNFSLYDGFGRIVYARYTQTF